MDRNSTQAAQTTDGDLAERARRLLTDYFTGKTEAQRINCLRDAFAGLSPDPRAAIETTGAAVDFAAACVARLLEFGCTGGRRHALTCLLAHIREIGFGTHPPADYIDLRPLLDARCALPSREDELAYLNALIEREGTRARLYSPLGALARALPTARASRKLTPWQDHKDIALLLHRPRRPCRPCREDECGQTGQVGRPYDDILAAFERVRQAALLGAPGAGKSTTLRRLAVDRARRAIADPGAALPLLVPLGLWTADQGLDAFLAAQVPVIGPAAAALAEQGRLILLLDGLNEVPSARRGARAAAITALRDRLPPGTPCIVSCREDDYVGDLALDLDSLTLTPLTPQRVRAVLRHWLADEGRGSADRLFWQLAGDEGLAGVLQTWRDAGGSEDDFWGAGDIADHEQVYQKTTVEQDRLWRDHVPNPRGLLRLAANPFMLTMLYVTWARHDGALPRNRGEVFAGFIEVLLSREGLIRRDPDSGSVQRDPRADRLLDGLAAIAWRMQGERSARAAADEGDAEVLTALPRSEVLGLLATEDLLKIAEDATLLEGSDEVRFRHQLLQEHFTALALRRRLESGGLDPGQLWPRERWWQRSGWEEAAVLLAGLHGDDCTPVIRWLAEHQPEVAAQCIRDSGAGVADRPALLRELHDAWLPRLTDIEAEPAPQARAAVGRALGDLGCDDRRGVGLRSDGLPDIDWVAIHGGAFVYQDGERRTCGPFRIARYPVTHAQFQAFLDDPDGHVQDRWWAGLSDPDRRPARARWPISNHPREMVSWHEAMAFCAWLTDRLGVGDEGLVVRLPTEWEWERAARGTEGRVYPWGKDYRAGYANIDETWEDAGFHRLGRTSPVGAYPQGASCEGILDLSGNVWEWCLNDYGDPARMGLGGSGSRVVRGGSWSLDCDCVRAAYRNYDRPRNRNDSIGFRVLLSSPIR